MYEQEECSIPAGMGKYMPEQTNCGVTGDILIEISDKTVLGLILPRLSTRSRRNKVVFL